MLKLPEHPPARTEGTGFCERHACEEQQQGASSPFEGLKGAPSDYPPKATEERATTITTHGW